jgi:RHS repeat-associated protein
VLPGRPPGHAAGTDRPRRQCRLGRSVQAWGQAKEVICDAARKAGISNPIRFQGQYWDEETGLHYNRYRYYHPHSGRFASRDPIGLLGGLNAHAYAPNSVQWALDLKRREDRGEKPNGSHSYASDINCRGNRFRDRKAHRSVVANARWDPHGDKHMKANSREDAAARSSGSGAAQYLPTVNNRALERTPAQKGIVHEKNGGKTLYFFYRSDDVVGYDQGKPTHWIRAEITSGTLHGHPMSESRVVNYGCDIQPGTGG